MGPRSTWDAKTTMAGSVRRTAASPRPGIARNVMHAKYPSNVHFHHVENPLGRSDVLRAILRSCTLSKRQNTRSTQQNCLGSQPRKRFPVRIRSSISSSDLGQAVSRDFCQMEASTCSPEIRIFRLGDSFCIFSCPPDEFLDSDLSGQALPGSREQRNQGDQPEPSHGVCLDQAVEEGPVDPASGT